MNLSISNEKDLSTIYSMNSDRFDYWCNKILYLSYTLYTLACIKSFSTVDDEVFDDILEPLKKEYFASIDVLSTMGCNLADFLDTSSVPRVTYYKATINTLRNLPQTAIFTDSVLKQLIFELEQDQERCQEQEQKKVQEYKMYTKHNM